MEKMKNESDSLFGNIEAIGDSNKSSKTCPKWDLKKLYEEGKISIRNLFYFEEEKWDSN